MHGTRRYFLPAGIALCMIGLVALLGRSASIGRPSLDAAGHALLDPLRDEAVSPKLLIARLLIAPTDTVADVGAGPGFLTLPLARAVPKGHVIATDIRADYLRVLDERARAAGLDHVSTRLVTSNHPGLSPGSIDLVVLCQVDHYLPARASFFLELVASLRPGGRIAVVNHDRHRSAVEAAAKATSLALVDNWEPSPGFFANVYSNARRTQ